MLSTKTSGLGAFDALIALTIGAVAGLAGAGITVPADLNYALLALIAGRLGITVPPTPSP